MSLMMMKLNERERAWKFLALLLDEEAKQGEAATVSNESMCVYLFVFNDFSIHYAK